MRRTAASPLRAFLFVALPLLVGPLVLLWVTEPFPARLPLTLTFVTAMAERTWAMFFRAPDRFAAKARGDWTAPAVAVAYLVVMYAAVVEFYVHRSGPPMGAVAISSIALYAAAVALRYWAFAHLGHQWTVQVDEPLPDRRLVTDGPYRFLRHPIYLGTCVEAVTLPLALGAWIALAAALVSLIPLVVCRALLEERHMFAVFGRTYERYARSTPGIWPLLSRRRRRSHGR